MKALNKTIIFLVVTLILSFVFVGTSVIKGIAEAAVIIEGKTPTGNIMQTRPTISATIYSTERVSIDLNSIQMTLDGYLIEHTAFADPQWPTEPPDDSPMPWPPEEPWPWWPEEPEYPPPPEPVYPEVETYSKLDYDLSMDDPSTDNVNEGLHTVTVNAKDMNGLAAEEKTWTFEVVPWTWKETWETMPLGPVEVTLLHYPAGYCFYADHGWRYTAGGAGINLEIVQDESKALNINPPAPDFPPSPDPLLDPHQGLSEKLTHPRQYPWASIKMQRYGMPFYLKSKIKGQLSPGEWVYNLWIGWPQYQWFEWSRGPAAIKIDVRIGPPGSNAIPTHQITYFYADQPYLMKCVHPECLPWPSWHTIYLGNLLSPNTYITFQRDLTSDFASAYGIDFTTDPYSDYVVKEFSFGVTSISNTGRPSFIRIDDIEFYYKSGQPAAWRQDLQVGDILVCRSPKSPVSIASFYTHVGMYVGNNLVLEARPIEGVQYHDITEWDYKEGDPDSKTWVEIYRVEGLTEYQRNLVIQWAKSKAGALYDSNFAHKAAFEGDVYQEYGYDINADRFYCSELVWAAYLTIGYILEEAPDWGYVSPDEIAHDDNVVLIDGHYEDSPGVEDLFGISVWSPVQIVVTDPDHLMVSFESNEIAGAVYIVDDIDDDGDLDDLVGFSERKLGDYLVEVVPKPDALPTDTYSLKVIANDTTITLAENVQISDIPSKPYIIESTETLIRLKGDLDSDGDVDYGDYLIFRTAYRSCSGDAKFIPAADLDGDGCVTINDYRIFRSLI